MKLQCNASINAIQLSVRSVSYLSFALHHAPLHKGVVVLRVKLSADDDEGDDAFSAKLSCICIIVCTSYVCSVERQNLGKCKYERGTNIKKGQQPPTRPMNAMVYISYDTIE